ncbi:carbon monoxide dehydrogenase subunit G [Saccharopolyspora subtropica]|uniref:Carbon monoxide dehydrogenase subunit G n=1 Tax=Saccharopolyspora thermophila TaxID=89367 RepID=A0A917JVV5_9PSEU|nr:SRPBCC family protein [Saccharopolyspora subtropica]GGI88731.1 carbon monoxide dehydrogenase subunit G [Saccharopolyspora subtropica]
MRLTNEVVLPAPPEQVFALINDVERVAPCMPGATLEERVDDAYRGRVRVKVGPISAAYQGVVRFLEVDEPGHRLVLDARGTDQHGSGGAEAKVEVRVRPHDDGSVLALNTDLVVRGKVAQFGRGALAGVSQKLMEQFADNLGTLLTQPAPPRAAHAGPSRTEAPPAAPVVTAPSRTESAPVAAQVAPESELDGLALVALPLLKRVAPIAAALVVGALAGRVLGRGSRRPTVLADEEVTAILHIGHQRYQVPVRRTLTLLRRRTRR